MKKVLYIAFTCIFCLAFTSVASASSQKYFVYNNGKAVGNLQKTKANKYNTKIYKEIKYKKSSNPNDTYFSSQWSLNGAFGINAPASWDSYKPAAPALVAVVDTGVNYAHPDLQTALWTNPGEIASNGVDDDGDGQIDDIHGTTLINDPSGPAGLDNQGHGTHVAGIIGATRNNGIGVAGVSDAKIMSIKILDSAGNGTTSGLINSINYGIAHGAKIFNFSLGSSSIDNALYSAMQSAGNNYGAIFIIAAGNDEKNNDSSPTYPASFDLPNIISVASNSSAGIISPFSNYGKNSVDIAAPGQVIASTYIGGTGYANMSGTSMATPQVTGAVAMLSAQRPDLSLSAIRNIILGNVKSLATSTENAKVASGGELNLLDDLKVALNMPLDEGDGGTNSTNYKLTFKAKKGKKSTSLIFKSTSMVNVNKIKLSFNNKISIKKTKIKLGVSRVSITKNTTTKPTNWRGTKLSFNLPSKKIKLKKGNKCVKYTFVKKDGKQIKGTACYK